MEKTIIININGVYITPYVEGQCPDLERLCSHYDKKYHKRIYTSGFPISEENCFICHYISAERLKGWFPDYRIIRSSAYLYTNMKCKLRSDVTLKDNQVDIMASLINNNSHEVFLNVPTAFGKTYLGVVYATHIQTKTLIVCKSLKILSQWKETIEKITVGNKNVVIHIKGSEILEEYLTNGDPENHDFYLVTPATLSSFASKHYWFGFSELVDKLGIGLKIIDEAHLNIGNTVRINGSTNIYKSLYLSADATRGNREASEAFNDAFYYVPLLKLSSEEFEKLRHIIGTFITYDSQPTASDIMQIQGGYYNWSHTQYARYEWNRGITQDKIIDVLDEIISANNNVLHYKTLILLYTIEHVEEFVEILQERYRGIFTVGKFHSKMKDDEKAESLKCNLIVSIYGSFGVGVDVVDPEIRYVISTIPIDPVNTNQAAGRCRPIKGLNSFIWMLYDTGFSYCQSKMTRVADYLKNSKIKAMYIKNDGVISREDE